MITALGALANGSLLPAGQHREMWTTVSTEGGHWIPYARYGLGLFEFDEQVTGGRPLRAVGGSLWGSWFFAVATPAGDHTLAVHTSTEWKSWELMFDLVEAEFGIAIG